MVSGCSLYISENYLLYIEIIMKEKVSVSKGKQGDWIVKFSTGKGQSSAIFQSKVEAVSNARSKSTPSKIVVGTASGQIIRPPSIQTSKTRQSMRDAVLGVVSSRVADSAALKARKA